MFFWELMPSEVFIWKGEDDEECIPLEHHGKNPMTSLALSHDGLLIATAMGSRVQGWKLSNIAESASPQILADVSEDNTCVAFHPLHVEIAIGLKSGGIQIVGRAKGVDRTFTRESLCPQVALSAEWIAYGRLFRWDSDSIS